VLLKTLLFVVLVLQTRQTTMTCNQSY